MTKPEWLRICGRLARLWPHQPIPPPAAGEWYSLLGDLSGELVDQAVTVLAAGGREFPPPPGLIRQTVLQRDQPTVTFEEAWSAIQRQVELVGRYRESDALEKLEAYPLAAELVGAMGGWQAICNAGPDEARPTDPGVWRSQAEHAFRALVDRQRTDLALVLMPGRRGQHAMRRLGDILQQALPPPELSGD